MAKVNRLLWESVEPDRFVTSLFGVLDTAARRFTYVNAGHNPALLYRAATGQFDTLEPTGPLLGTFESATYKERVVEIRPGDVLVMYSDGVTEAMSQSGELFGEERLRKEIEARKTEPATVQLRGIWEAVQTFQGGEQDDDVTIVVVRGQAA
jgi:sigma-B regulation protein RsbU (phosphoserine phosphatase)